MLIFNDFTVLVAICIANFMAIAFFTQIVREGRNYIANCFLAGFYVAFSLAIFCDILYANKVYQHYPSLFFLDQIPILLIGPTVYFYCLFITKNDQVFKWKYFYHLSSIIIYLLWMAVFKVHNLDKLTHRLSNVPFMSEYYAKLQMFLYLVLTYKLVRKHNKIIKNLLSNTENNDLKWINNFVVLILVIFVAWVLADQDLLNGNLLRIFLVVFSYWVGYQVIKQRDIYEHLSPGFKIESVDTFSDNAKYKNSRLNADEKLKYVNRISECMQAEKPYLENELTLTMLADKLKMKPNFLSQILNEGFGENFYSFINRHRIEESKHLLRDKKYNNYNIQGIAFEAGFNSKSTFNKSFKELVGVSPSDYQKQHKATN